METKLKNSGEVTIVMIKGILEIEQTQPFRDACAKHLTSQKVIFNMEQANFVGSTGLQPFIEAVKTLTQENKHGLKMVCQKVEFRRIFQNLDILNLEIYEDEAGALASFTKPVDV